MWYIVILSLCIILIYYTYTNKEGFADPLIPLLQPQGKAQPNYVPNDGRSSSNVSSNLYANAFPNTTSFVPAPVSLNTLMSNIQFCKETAQRSNAFANPQFADTCGICMTRGTILSDPNPFSYVSNTLGTGIVVYPGDKSFSRQQGTPAVPSAQSAYCEPLVIDTKSMPSNVNPNNITSVAINQEQYDDTVTYLKSLQLINLSNTSNCAASIRETLSCSNMKTLSGINLTYGRFSSACDTASNVSPNSLMSTNVYIPDSIGKQTYTLTSNLPAGQRQWTLAAQCTVNEEPIPPNLPTLSRRWGSNYYWTNPFTISVDARGKGLDIPDVTIFGSVTLTKDTVVTIKYATNAAFSLRLHGVNQYTSSTSTGMDSFIKNSTRLVITPSTQFTLYKGENTIALEMRGSPSGNVVAFSMTDLAGTTIATLDSTWVYTTTSQAISTPKPSLTLIPAPPTNLSPSIQSYTFTSRGQPINLYTSFTLPSEQLCTFTASLQNNYLTISEMSLNLRYNNLEKQVATWKKDSYPYVLSYTDYFPKGTTSVHLSLSGTGTMVIIPILYAISTPNPEVFAVGKPSYFAPKGQAASVCAELGATLATSNQVFTANQKGANWCYTGWVSDVANAIYPITYDTMGGCGNGSPGIKIWDYGTAGVTCFGAKPAQGEKGYNIIPFNPGILYNQQPIIAPDSPWKTDKLEAFAVGKPSYFARRGQAASVCAELGAALATSNDVFVANQKGANWCYTGWVSDLANAIYPITYDTMGGCGNGRSGVMMWDNGIAGVTCFGAKPTVEQAAAKGYTVQPFNKNTFFQP